MKKIFGLLITALIGYGVYYVLFSVPVQPTGQTQNIVIEKGQSLKEIAGLLKTAGYIRSTFGFETYVWLKNLGGKLQAGDYKLPAGLSLGEITGYLSKGLGATPERRLTIIEGWSEKEIADYLAKEGVGQSNEFLKIVSPQSRFTGADFQFLNDKPKKVGLEGYLFPDTYRVYKDATMEDVVKKMLQTFDEKLTPETRNAIDKRGRTIFDIVRMASIIEAEVPHSEDRAIVSDILWKRLEAGMLLQCDSTLNYATEGKNRALTLEELKIDSPYNSYKYPGLSPTPIGNPGLGAIKAAIYPESSPYWFFLSSKEGKTIFSKNLDEHNAAKAKYLK
ncbi:MAG: endolytic transglycosylase MltG [bacterium]|nr:endolytic transglycosylase MltG [bacterium]